MTIQSLRKKILLVDDDNIFSRSLTYNLEQAGYEVNSANSAERGLELAGDYKPALIVLDIGLPGMDGLEALRFFQDKAACPVIFVTARRRELDEILGLELGADDYITKPFDIDILLARIKAVLRRSTPLQKPQSDNEKTLVVGDIRIDPQKHLVFKNENPIHLTPLEFKLLHTLAQQAEHVFSTDELLTTIWGENYIGEPQVIYVHLRGLRKKLETDPNNPQRIITIRGVGYKFTVR